MLGWDDIRDWFHWQLVSLVSLKMNATLVGGFSPYPSEKSWSESQLG